MCLGEPGSPPFCLNPPTAQSSGTAQALTASTRLLALPWNGRPWGPAGLGTVSDTGRALRGVPTTPQGVGSPTWESQWMDGKLLVSLSLDSAPSSRRVGTGRRLSDFIFTFHFHALEKEMATHPSVLAAANQPLHSRVITVCQPLDQRLSDA